ncbi:cupin domain-containing protein [Komagataeibacter sp. FNDCR1]|nr:cupin domain-containing protein [Komagataeibacter sp. FNDCR1]
MTETPPTHGTALDLRDPGLDAARVRAALSLAPHPEGGSYREVWREARADGGRGSVSTIEFLLAEGERSHWHRVDAAEIWCWQAGGPLRLRIAAGGQAEQVITLGPRPDAGEVLQAVVPAGAWQAAESMGRWSLVACIVAPAFLFERFELAPPGWSPAGTRAGHS